MWHLESRRALIDLKANEEEETHLQFLEGEIPALQRDFPRLRGCREEDTK